MVIGRPGFRDDILLGSRESRHAGAPPADIRPPPNARFAGRHGPPALPGCCRARGGVARPALGGALPPDPWVATVGLRRQGFAGLPPPHCRPGSLRGVGARRWTRPDAGRCQVHPEEPDMMGRADRSWRQKPGTADPGHAAREALLFEAVRTCGVAQIRLPVAMGRWATARHEARRPWVIRGDRRRRRTLNVNAERRCDRRQRRPRGAEIHGGWIDTVRRAALSPTGRRSWPSGRARRVQPARSLQAGRSLALPCPHRGVSARRGSYAPRRSSMHSRGAGADVLAKLSSVMQ